MPPVLSHQGLDACDQYIMVPQALASFRHLPTWQCKGFNLADHSNCKHNALAGCQLDTFITVADFSTNNNNNQSL
jgi:hypothetical protein